MILSMMSFMSCSINGIISLFNSPVIHVTRLENIPLNGANPVAFIVIFLENSNFNYFLNYF